MSPNRTLSSESTIPVPRTPLIGRDSERRSVGALVVRPDVPLVTLNGPGGVGKTRIALRVAADLSKDFEGNVRFIPLATIREPQLVLPTIAQSVGLVGLSDQTPMAGLLRYLSGRSSLLIVDNFEQVMPAAAEISELLAHCPELTILITSREPLRIEGEHEFPILPLAVPSRPSPIEVARQSESMQLFEQRAQAVRPDFSISPENVETVAEICIRLDGLPLAIELAAARVKILSPQAILSRLVDRLALLSRDGRDVPDRLRTMRDAVGWSYDLLTDEERALFRHLSVFAGGCTTEMAASLLANLDVAQPIDLFEGMSSLLDKNLLVQVDQTAGEPRFRMLETIRAYALEQLDAHGEAHATRDALTAWLIDRTTTAFDEQWGPNQRTWTNFFELEVDNLRAVIAWLLEQGDVDGASWMIVNASRCWHIRGNLAEGWSWAERALALGDAIGIGTKRHRLELMAGWFLFHMGEIDRATAMLLSARARANALSDPYIAAQCRHVLGFIDDSSGRFDDAVAHFEAALGFYRSAGYRTWEAFALNSLGHANFELGNIDQAERHFDEALSVFLQDGNSYGAGMILTNQAKIARARGDLRHARSLFVESLALRWEHQERIGLVGCLRGLGQIEVLAGRHEKAAQLFGAADALREAIGAELPRPHSRYAQARTTACRHLGDDRFAACWEHGRQTPLEDMVAMVVRTDLDGLAARPIEIAQKPFDLTNREREVLRHIRIGRSNKEIAEALFVSERTAQTHVQHILDKMDVNTRAAAAALAVEHNID